MSNFLPSKNKQISFNVKVSLHVQFISAFQVSNCALPAFPYAWASLCLYHTRHNGIQKNDIQHNDTQHNEIQHNDTEHNDIQHHDTHRDDIQHYNELNMI
jgi:hypothetical protein